MRITAIVTDSAATVPREMAEQYDIGVVPMQITFGRKTFRDGVDMSSAEFYRRLAAAKHLPKTSAPAVGDLLAAYKEAGQRAEAVVAVHTSANLSATVSAACRAAGELDTTVHVLDSRTGAASQALIVLAAARAALDGAGPEKVLAAARWVMDRVHLLVAFETLEYLRKGGRIGAAQAWLATALRFKPIVTLSGGVVKPVERPRTRRRAIGRMVKLMTDAVQGQPVHAAVLHGEAPADAEELRESIAGRLDCRELFITEFTPVMGAHTGPGIIGLAWWAED
jgi:DegV family protein with EDD domain